MLRFKFFIAVTTPKNGGQALEIVAKHGARGVIAMPGKGCAKHEILADLGFEDDKKQVITGFVAEENEDAMLDALYDGLLYKRGAGLAFTIDVQGFIGIRSVFASEF